MDMLRLQLYHGRKPACVTLIRFSLSLRLTNKLENQYGELLLSKSAAANVYEIGTLPWQIEPQNMRFAQSKLTKLIKSRRQCTE